MMWQTIKTVLWSAIGGAVVWWIVLSAVFGWVSPGRAEKQASERAQAAMLDALTPICVAKFEQDVDREAKLAALKQASSWRRDDFVKEQGWATIPGSKHPEARIAAACVDRILTPNS